MFYLIMYLLIGFIVASYYSRYHPTSHGSFYSDGSGFLLTVFMWPTTIFEYIFNIWIKFIQKR